MLDAFYEFAIVNFFVPSQGFFGVFLALIIQTLLFPVCANLLALEYQFQNLSDWQRVLATIAMKNRNSALSHLLMNLHHFDQSSHSMVQH